MEHFVKIEYSQFEPDYVDKLEFMGYLDEIMPIEEMRRHVKEMGWATLFTALNEQVSEEGVVDIFLVIDDETKRVKMYERGDILKIIEGDAK